MTTCNREEQGDIIEYQICWSDALSLTSTIDYPCKNHHTYSLAFYPSLLNHSWPKLEKRIDWRYWLHPGLEHYLYRYHINFIHFIYCCSVLNEVVCVIISIINLDQGRIKEAFLSLTHVVKLRSPELINNMQKFRFYPSSDLALINFNHRVNILLGWVLLCMFYCTKILVKFSLYDNRSA